MQAELSAPVAPPSGKTPSCCGPGPVPPLRRRAPEQTEPTAGPIPPLCRTVGAHLPTGKRSIRGRPFGSEATRRWPRPSGEKPARGHFRRRPTAKSEVIVAPSVHGPIPVVVRPIEDRCSKVKGVNPAKEPSQTSTRGVQDMVQRPTGREAYGPSATLSVGGPNAVDSTGERGLEVVRSESGVDPTRRVARRRGVDGPSRRRARGPGDICALSLHEGAFVE
jgi:hypothetical protein